VPSAVTAVAADRFGPGRSVRGWCGSGRAL